MLGGAMNSANTDLIDLNCDTKALMVPYSTPKTRGILISIIRLRVSISIT